MNARGCLTVFSIVLAFVVLRVLLGCFFAVYQTEQVIITQFGKPIGEPITEPGLHFKLPIIQEVNRIDKRFLEWDGLPVAIPTRDKTYIHVDTFARWRISDAKTYFVRLHDERSAQSRLEDILGSETRNAVAKNDLIEIIRTDKNRKPLHDENLKNVQTGLGTIGVLPPIQYGRQKIEDEIKAKAAGKLAEFGIELLDVRLKRVNYNPDVLDLFYRQRSFRFAKTRQRKASNVAAGALNYTFPSWLALSLSHRPFSPLRIKHGKSVVTNSGKISEIFVKFDRKTGAVCNNRFLKQ